MRCQLVAADSVERSEFADMRGANRITGRVRLDRGDHQIFGGVLRRDEFKNFCAVSCPFQELGAQRVRDELRLPFLKDPVAQRLAEHRRCLELTPQLFLTAWRNHEQLGASGQPACEGIVGCRVARMECDQNVQLFEIRAGDRASHKAEIFGEILFARDPVAKFDELRPRLDPHNFCAMSQQVSDGERQVTFATAHVRNAKRRCHSCWRRKCAWCSGRSVFDGSGTWRTGFFRTRQIVEQMREQLREFLNLPKFVRHAFAGLSSFVGDAEGAQPRRMERNEVNFRAIVSRGFCGRRRRSDHCFGSQATRAVRLTLELRRGGRGEEMGVKEIRADQRAEFSKRFGRRMIFSYIASRMTPKECEVKPGL